MHVLSPICLQMSLKAHVACNLARVACLPRGLYVLLALIFFLFLMNL